MQLAILITGGLTLAVALTLLFLFLGLGSEPKERINH